MYQNLKGKDLLSLHEITTEDLYAILDLAADLKAKQKAGIEHHLLKGKTLGMIFEKSSTRTRVSFETGMYQLGGQALFLSKNDLQIGRGEPIRDTARVLSRYLDGIMIRTFKHSTLEELAEYASVPVINALTDLLHPCQVLADLLTIKEHIGQYKGKKLAYIGDGNNMAHSLLYGCAKVGMDVAIASPQGYKPDETVVKNALADAAVSGATVTITDDVHEAAKGADVLYTDVWTSMGEEAEREQRLKDLAGYQINAQLLGEANEGCIVMHCLPAHRGEEITEDVLEAQADVIFDEAENRLHAQKAVMALTMMD
ncbi:MAG: ornithine carbamoyltransferase [Selenomonadaceae bacterium]|nr:ornithine carbamoyltransferase [Selenomonadaceae bacterium]